MKLHTYTSTGSKSSSIGLPKQYQAKENMVLLAQALRVYENRLHPGLSKTKRRGEIAATTRKVYRQKGTGMARHGAKSAPIFVGGGKAHGPTGLKRKLTLPKKMRRKALKVALSLKSKNGEVVVVSAISSLKKTKQAVGLIDQITQKEKWTGKNLRFTFALSEKNKNAFLALRNIKNVEVMPFRSLNAHKVYFGGILIVDKEALVAQKTQKKLANTENTEKFTETQKVDKKRRGGSQKK